MSWIDELRARFGAARAPTGAQLEGGRLFDGLRFGGALSKRDLEGLAKAGFRGVLRVGHEGEPGQLLSASVEGSWVHTFAMTQRRVYLHGLPRSSQVEDLRSALAELPRPAFLHSNGDGRAAALALVLLGEERGLDGERALAAGDAAGLGLDADDLRRFVREELARRAESTRPAPLRP